MDGNSIKVYLLDEKNLFEVNDKLISRHKIFAFLCPDNPGLDTPKHYDSNGCNTLMSQLYVLYHDMGMRFLELFADSIDRLSRHLRDSDDFRHVFGHKKKPQNIQAANKIVKDYLNGKFEDYKSFHDQDSEKDWQCLMCGFISDSNFLYERISKIANDEIPADEIKKKFKDKVSESMKKIAADYTDFAAEIYSIDKSYKGKAKKYVINKNDIKKNICDKFLKQLENGIYKSTNDIHNGMTQIFAESMKTYIEELKKEENDDILE